MIDPTEFGKAMGAIVREALAPILKRLEELEGRHPERGEKGEPGRDAEPVDGDAIVASAAEAAVASLLGGDGLKGLVDLQVAASLDEYLKANPIQHGRDGAPGERGEPGEKGEPGAAGVGLADALINRDGELVLTLADGRTKSLGVVVGRDGAAGANGRDGLSVADVSRTYDAESHEVVERWAVAGEAKELRYPAGGIRPGGFWREGMKCHALQAITHDGALWIAKRDTASKPCLECAEDWQLAARKGRDGRDGKDGKPPPGPVKLGGGDGA